jgi:hypothetical protein
MGLLYLSAVRDDWREQENRESCIDVDPASLTAPEVVGPQESYLRRSRADPTLGSTSGPRRYRASQSSDDRLGSDRRQPQEAIYF